MLSRTFTFAAALCLLAPVTSFAQTSKDTSDPSDYNVPPAWLVDQAWLSYEASMEAHDEARSWSSYCRSFSGQLQHAAYYWEMSALYQAQAGSYTAHAIQLLSKNYVTQDELATVDSFLRTAHALSQVATDLAHAGTQAMGGSQNEGLFAAQEAEKKALHAVELLAIVIDPGML